MSDIGRHTKMLAVCMTWSLERSGVSRERLDQLFGILWRFAIVLLPWQTRWFFEGPALGGYPWEGGRVSVYVSWVAMIVTIAVGCLLRGARRVPGPRGGRRGWATFVSAMVGVLAIVLLFLSTYPLATWQWLVEVFLLGCFAWVLVRSIERDDLARWIVYAIIPHAVLGIAQHVSQAVVGSKWLGMASQNPLTPGVSIVEVVGRRWLRAYGGFPHPNILGGWLVLGIGCALRLVSLKKAQRVFLYGALTIFSVCLVLTFSRSAWLALVFFLIVTSIEVSRLKQTVNRRSWMVACGFVLAVVATTIAARWPLVAVRGDSQTRLEQRSVDERLQGWRNGVALFEGHSWMGVGPRATGFALLKEGIVSANTIPVLPHVVPLLILDEVGLVGALLLLWAAYRCRRAILSNPLFLGVLPIFFLDHYPWSTWSGLAWSMLIFCLVFAKDPTLDT